MLSNNEKSAAMFAGTALAWLLIFAVVVGAWGCPQYNVWERGMKGKSELAQADYNRQIQTREAEAKRESSKALAEAEVIRAEGVAKANKIIGDSLKGNEAYLHYLWVNALDRAESNVIYVPTEANMPIMEAGRAPSARAKLKSEDAP